MQYLERREFGQKNLWIVTEVLTMQENYPIGEIGVGTGNDQLFVITLGVHWASEQRGYQEQAQNGYYSLPHCHPLQEINQYTNGSSDTGKIGEVRPQS